MFTLFPRRWTHWLLLLVGPLFLASYFGLLSWAPVKEAVGQLTNQPAGVSRAEGLLGLVSLLLLTPIVGMVGLFLLLFALVVLAGTLAPVARMSGIPQWVFTLLVAVGSSGTVYANREAWVPWFLQALDRVASAYLVLLL